jgi:hypothetical protein
MKNTFLNKLSNSGLEMDKFISKFMDIKLNIGNGVGAGKLFESLFVAFINNYNKVGLSMEGLTATHLNLSNSSFIWDIIISDCVDANQKKQEIIDVIKNGVDIESNISSIIGDNWIGISLKTYKENACQITTDYSYRTFLEDTVGESELIGEDVDTFFNMLNKHDKNRYAILALNTYEQGTYSFRLLSFDKKFDKVSYKKNIKLSQYDLSINGVNYFKVLYGKNQANPFQRGIWTHNNNSIEYFQLIKSGNYEVDDYFQTAILSTIFE